MLVVHRDRLLTIPCTASDFFPFFFIRRMRTSRESTTGFWSSHSVRHSSTFVIPLVFLVELERRRRRQSGICSHLRCPFPLQLLCVIVEFAVTRCAPDGWTRWHAPLCCRKRWKVNLLGSYYRPPAGLTAINRQEKKTKSSWPSKWCAPGRMSQDVWEALDPSFRSFSIPLLRSFIFYTLLLVPCVIASCLLMPPDGLFTLSIRFWWFLATSIKSNQNEIGW